MNGMTENNKISEFRRVESVDVLKGIAILMVIVTHLGFSAESRRSFGFPFWIDMAVPVFMLLTGYVMLQSYGRHGVNDFKSAYDLGALSRSLLRIAIPYALILPLEAVPRAIQGASLWELFSCCVIGGWGPGGYYFPVITQILVVLPAVYLVFRKSPVNGFLLCVIGNVLFEVLQRAIGMSDGLYRLICFRYLGIVGAGMWMGCVGATAQRSTGKFLLGLAGVVGGAYIIATQYFHLVFPVFEKWSRTSFLASLWVVPFVWACVRSLGKGNSRVFVILSALGAASWGIMLVQKAYFFMLAHVFHVCVESMFVSGVMALVICTLLGYGYDRVSRRFVTIVNKILSLG